jgi:hypothetical protein
MKTAPIFLHHIHRFPTSFLQELREQVDFPRLVRHEVLNGRMDRLLPQGYFRDECLDYMCRSTLRLKD